PLPRVLVRRQAAGHAAVFGLAAATQHVKQRLAFPAVAVPYGFFTRRDLDYLRQLPGAPDAKDLGLVPELRTIRKRQRVQIPAVALESVLGDDRRPPRRHRRWGLFLDRQLIVHRAVERDTLLGRDRERRQRRGSENGEQDLFHGGLTRRREWSYLCR